MDGDGYINPETGMSRFYGRVFAIFAAAAVAVALFYTLRPFIVPGLWACLFTAILHPLKDRLERKRKWGAGRTAGVLTATAAVVIVLPITLVSLIFARQAAELLNVIQLGAEQQHIDGLSDVLEHPMAQKPLKLLDEYAGVKAIEIVPWIKSGAQKVVQTLLGVSGQLFVGALGVVGNFFLIMFLLFFFLRDGDDAVRIFVRLIPLARDRKQALLVNLLAVARAVFMGTLITALVQGTLVGIGFALAGLPSAIVFGVLAMGASLVPVVGTSLVWGPAAVVLLAQGRVGGAIFIAIWGVVVVGSIDNFLRPLLISGQAGVPTLLVFAGVLGGLSGFGGVGIFLGPLVLTLAVALVRYANEMAMTARVAPPTPLPPTSPVPPPPEASPGAALPAK
jgi:predicted PurR-regulated permease PerM